MRDVCHNLFRMRAYPLVLLLTFGISCAAVTPEDKLTELESVIQTQFKIYETLKNRISGLEEKVASLKSKREVDKLDQQPLLEKDDATNGGVHLRELAYLKATEHISKRQTSPVAFHAYMNNNHCYTTGNRLVFDVVPVDVGIGFAHDHSTYNVPVSGIYVLTWTVAVPQQSSKMVSELVVNSNSVEGVTISDPDYIFPAGSGSGVHPSTGVAIVQLQQRDLVSIRVKQYTGSCTSDINVVGDNNLVRTTFSGWSIS